MSDGMAVGAQPQPLQRAAARIAVALHLVLIVIGTPMAVLSAVPPVTLRWLGPTLAVLAGWTAIYIWVALTRGLVAWLIAVDLAVTTTSCLFIGHLVPVAKVATGASWMAVLLSDCLISTQLAWLPWLSVPAGFLVIGGYLVGARLAGAPGGGLDQGLVAVIQVVGTATVMVLVRRARRAADTVLAQTHEADRAAAVERARRADERAQLRLLHDTVLATLTMVGSGAIDRSSRTLSARAAADLAVVESLLGSDPDGVDPGGPERGDTDPGRSVSGHADREVIRLDRRLAEVARAERGVLSVSLALAVCEVPADVAEAFASGVAEALRNVLLHAGVDAVEVRLRDSGDLISAEVIDHGRGFDPATVPAHRYGVRESVAARMSSVGGRAELRSAPGEGTHWLLEWTRG